MGRTRTPPRTDSPAEETLAILIAALLLGATEPPPGFSREEAIAGLLALAPLSQEIPKALRGPTSVATARLVLRDLPDAPNGSGAILRASRGEFGYSAAYAVAAFKRLAAGMASPGGKGLEDALRDEARYYARHREASGRRRAAMRATEAMAEMHGPVLVWSHGATRKPAEPRPAHLRSDGARVDLRVGLPAGVASLPGAEPNCSCAWRA